MHSQILAPDEYGESNAKFFKKGSTVRLLRLTSAGSNSIPTGKELVGHLARRLVIMESVAMVVTKVGSMDHWTTEPIILAQKTDMGRLILRSAKETYLLELVIP